MSKILRVMLTLTVLTVNNKDFENVKANILTVVIYAEAVKDSKRDVKECHSCEINSFNSKWNLKEDCFIKKCKYCDK